MYRGQICNLDTIDTLSLLGLTIGYLLAFHICRTYRSMSSLLLPVKKQANGWRWSRSVAHSESTGAIPTEMHHDDRNIFRTNVEVMLVDAKKNFRAAEIAAARLGNPNVKRLGGLANAGNSYMSQRF